MNYYRKTKLFKRKLSEWESQKKSSFNKPAYTNKFQTVR